MRSEEATRYLLGSPLYGVPSPRPESYKIAFYGDPSLGAALAHRHEVLWLTPGESAKVIENEQPDFLLITPRADSLRNLRAKPLVDNVSKEISDDADTILRTFSAAEVPICYYGILDRVELDRYLPIARRADLVMSESEGSLRKYNAQGVTNACFHELGAFGYTQRNLKINSEGEIGFLKPYALKTGGVSSGNDYATARQENDIRLVDQSMDPLHGPRVGLELVRHASWQGKLSSLQLNEFDALLLSGKSWTFIPPAFLDAAFKGIIPVVIGADDDLNRLKVKDHGLMHFGSIGQAAHELRRMNRTRRYAALKRTAAAISLKRLVDDWLNFVAFRLGVSKRRELSPSRVLRIPAAENAVATTLRSINLIEPDFLSCDSIEQNSSWKSIKLPVPIVPHSDLASLGIPLDIVDIAPSAHLTAEDVNLSRGWRRLTHSREATVYNEHGKRIVSTTICQAGERYLEPNDVQDQDEISIVRSNARPVLIESLV